MHTQETLTGVKRKTKRIFVYPRKNRVSRKPEVSVCFDIRVYSIERKWGQWPSTYSRCMKQQHKEVYKRTLRHEQCATATGKESKQPYAYFKTPVH